jgi:hypothetical protein
MSMVSKGEKKARYTFPFAGEGELKRRNKT